MFVQTAVRLIGVSLKKKNKKALTAKYAGKATSVWAQRKKAARPLTTA